MEVLRSVTLFCTCRCLTQLLTMPFGECHGAIFFKKSAVNLLRETFVIHGIFLKTNPNLQVGQVEFPALAFNLVKTLEDAASQSG